MTETFNVSAQLAICSACKQPAFIINGVLKTASTMAMVNGKPTLTPHTDECPVLAAT